MDKILIRLLVPAVGDDFDLFVPAGLEIGVLTSLLAEGVNELCGGRYNLSGEEMLNQKDPDRLLNPLNTLADYSVEDGAILVLI